MVTEDRAAARAHAAAVLAAGHPVLVEEYLAGPEVSLFAICDGQTARAAAARPGLQAGRRRRRRPEHRRHGRVRAAAVGAGGHGRSRPAHRPRPGARRDGLPRHTFTGVLYAGLVLTADGPQVIEFNCRFGDPETQVVLELLDTPLGTLLAAAAAGRLADVGPLSWRPGAAVTVVIAAENYPGPPVTGDVDHRRRRRRRPARRHRRWPPTAGSSRRAGGCCRWSPPAATWRRRARAYALVDRIGLRGSQHRTDIALAAARAASWCRARPEPRPARSDRAVAELDRGRLADDRATPCRTLLGSHPRPPRDRIGALSAVAAAVMRGRSRRPPRSAVAPFYVMRVLAAAARRAERGEAGVQPRRRSAVDRRRRSRCWRPRTARCTARSSATPRLPASRRCARRSPGTTAAATRMEVDPDDVVVTTGSSGGFLLAFLSAFDVGAGWGWPGPGYPAYRNILHALGCEVVDLPCGPETRYQPTAGMIDGLGARRAGRRQPGQSHRHHAGPRPSWRRSRGTAPNRGPADLRRDLPRHHLHRA